jgi:hypothetical protein
MNRFSRVLLVMAVSTPALGRAQETLLDYTYVELSYDESDFEVAGGGDIDGDGLTLSGSFRITDEWHAFASYGNADLDFGIDIDSWAIGAGYRYPLREEIDLYGRVLYIDNETDRPGPFDLDEDGLGLQLRIRSLVTDVLELEGGIQYIDVGDNDTSLQALARYHFTDALSAGIGLTFAGDTDGISINARFSF